MRAGIFADLTRRLEGGIDVTYESWEESALSVKEHTMYTNTMNAGIGLRFTPSTRQLDPYYLKIPVSIGMRYRTLYYKSYPVIDTIAETAVTCGIEFPLRNETGTLAASFEVGTRGEQSANGWNELFMGFSISLLGSIQ